MTQMQCIFDDVAYGVPFRLAADSPELLAAMKQCKPWEQCECDSNATAEAAAEFTLLSVGRKFQLMRDRIPCDVSDDLHEALNQLARELMIHVADHTPDRVFLHAGVVEWRGQALVMPGKSFAGKSTLVAALVRAGATYYSDEYAVIDADGLVHPYARDLSLRESGGVTQRPVSVAELGGRTGIDPVPVSHIVFAEYCSSAVWKPEPMTQGTAALAMMEHAIAVQRYPQRVMSALAQMTKTATALRSRRGDAASTAAILLQIMSEGQQA